MEPVTGILVTFFFDSTGFELRALLLPGNHSTTSAHLVSMIYGGSLSGKGAWRKQDRTGKES
jgi:hypothetical protein